MNCPDIEIKKKVLKKAKKMLKWKFIAADDWYSVEDEGSVFVKNFTKGHDADEIKAAVIDYKVDRKRCRVTVSIFEQV